MGMSKGVDRGVSRYGVHIGMGMVFSGSADINVKVRPILSPGLTTWTPSQVNSQEKGKARQSRKQVREFLCKVLQHSEPCGDLGLTC